MSVLQEARPRLAAAAPLTLIRIHPSRGWASLDLRQLWAYRELLYFLVWRDIKVKYKQTLLGAAWAIIQPFFTMVVFSIFFGRLARIPSDGIPYPLFTYAALVPWTFFANGFSHAANSLVGNAHLITKIYFPRLIIPMATVLSGVVDAALAFAVLLGLMLYFQILPTAHILWLPCVLLLTFVTALGAGFWLAALNVQFRDIRYVMPFLTQFWMILTPIAYSSTLLEERWRILYGLNPMAGVIDGTRWALLNTPTGPGPMMIVSAVVSLLILVGGAFYFRRMERSFADVI